MKEHKGKVKKIDKEIDNFSKKAENGWDLAIKDAEALLTEEKAKMRQIRDAIRAFANLRDSGAPFPDEASPGR
jgi:hypothetical protein